MGEAVREGFLGCARLKEKLGGRGGENKVAVLIRTDYPLYKLMKYT